MTKTCIKIFKRYRNRNTISYPNFELTWSDCCGWIKLVLDEFKVGCTIEDPKFSVWHRPDLILRELQALTLVGTSFLWKGAAPDAKLIRN